MSSLIIFIARSELSQEFFPDGFRHMSLCRSMLRYPSHNPGDPRAIEGFREVISAEVIGLWDVRGSASPPQALTALHPGTITLP